MRLESVSAMQPGTWTQLLDAELWCLRYRVRTVYHAAQFWEGFDETTISCFGSDLGRALCGAAASGTNYVCTRPGEVRAATAERAGGRGDGRSGGRSDGSD